MFFVGIALYAASSPCKVPPSTITPRAEKKLSNRPSTPSGPAFDLQPQRWADPPDTPPGTKLLLAPNKDIGRRRLDKGAVDMSKQQPRWSIASSGAAGTADRLELSVNDDITSRRRRIPSGVPFAKAEPRWRHDEDGNGAAAAVKSQGGSHWCGDVVMFCVAHDEGRLCR